MLHVCPPPKIAARGRRMLSLKAAGKHRTSQKSIGLISVVAGQGFWEGCVLLDVRTQEEFAQDWGLFSSPPHLARCLRSLVHLIARSKLRSKA